MMRKLLSFIFPPYCLHCKIPLSNAFLFCKECASDWEFIDHERRCPYCFLENASNKACGECLEKKRLQFKMASAVDYFGSIFTFIQELKNGKKPYLAKTAAAFMYVQFQHLQWKQPDWIVPIPSRLYLQGLNHAALIAHELSKLLKVPVLNGLIRLPGDLSQSRLAKNEINIYGKNFKKTRGKKLLIVDDLILSGSTFRKSYNALMEGYPDCIFALSLARKMV